MDMNKRLHFLLFLSVVILFPRVAMAQGISPFASQKIVIADIIDRSDRPINSAIKTLIIQGYRNVLVKSEDYEVIEINVEDIKNQLRASGRPETFPNICEKIGQKADFILFTTIRSTHSAFGGQSQSVRILITTSLYRIKTSSEQLADQGSAIPDEKAILDESSRLISNVLGIPIKTSKQQTTQETSQERRSTSQPQSTYSTPANQQRQQYTTSHQSNSYPMSNKVVVWEVETSNSNISQSIKDCMRTEIIKVVRNHNNYTVHDLDNSGGMSYTENSIIGVRDKIKRIGLSYSHNNIAKVLRESYRVTHVIFTKATALQSGRMMVDVTLFNTTQNTIANSLFTTYSRDGIFERDLSERVHQLLK